MLIMAGGACNLDPSIEPRLTELFSRAIAPAVGETRALCIDGGTDAGVMRMLGRALADSESKFPLIGIAPAGRVRHPDLAGGGVADGAPLEPHHSHFLLARGQNWGDEVDLMYDVAATLGGSCPVLQIVAGGGALTLREIRQATIRGWPILIIGGSGGVADELARYRHATFDGSVDSFICEILAEGDLHFFPSNASVEGLRRSMRQLIAPDADPDRYVRNQPNASPVLKEAWSRFAELDAASVRHQVSFGRIQLTALCLGVIATFVAIAKDRWLPEPAADASAAYLAVDRTAYAVVVIVSTLLTIFIAAANRLRQGDRWLLLRAAAEAVKREIFRYRTGTGEYRHRSGRAQVLTQRIGDITHRLIRTETNMAAITPCLDELPSVLKDADGDNRLKDLTPEGYIEVRLVDQRRFYRQKARKLERKIKALNWSILLIGGVGTVLAAIDFQVWIALTSSLVGAIATFLGRRQLEFTLGAYNQTATDLENIRTWWLGLSPAERASPNNAEMLVVLTERVLETELAGWMKQMTDALAELRKQQQAKEGADDRASEPAGEVAGAPVPIVTAELASITVAENAVESNGSLKSGSSGITAKVTNL
ncbi:hypothetical protein ABIE65_005177 [Constrictibacter sp. MBR-5]